MWLVLWFPAKINKRDTKRSTTMSPKGKAANKRTTNPPTGERSTSGKNTFIKSSLLFLRDAPISAAIINPFLT